MKLQKRRSDRSGRAPLSSPGRPSVAGRDERRRFWAAIAAGFESEDAALEADVPPAVGDKMVSDSRGDITRDVWTIGQAAFGTLSLVCRTGGNRAPSRARLLNAGGCSSSSGGQRRRSHGSCGAMLPLEAAVWSTARQQRNGTPNDPLAGQNRGSLRSTRPCEPMWRSDWLASSSLRAGRLCPGRPCPGKAVDMGGGRIGGGQTLGAQSRSPADFRSTSRTMRPCASAMKPSIKRCSFKDEVRCGAS